ncbi:helix-turn-helix domain-containing protein [Parafrankia sp. FMc6]|uniref:TetR/AcrR family transcriptional regulator n=1 Tax=Parafrankia soli TaxID=2599596 RepID=UPI0034D77793
MRADAERNRTAILAAAQQVFAERGLNVPLDEIARRAGVGEATLHRRFPDRALLIAGAFTDKMAAYADAAAEALTHDDPWEGFCAYVRRVCAMQSGDRGFADVLTVTFAAVNPVVEQLENHRSAAYRNWLTLIRNAKAAGGLRADFHAEDLVLLLMANAGVVAATADSAPDAWQRLVEYALQAFAAGNTQLLPAPPPRDALLQAMRRTQIITTAE